MIRVLKYRFYIKIALVAIAILLSAGTVFYTSRLVSQLEEKQIQIAEIWAESFRQLTSDQQTSGDITFIFDVIVSSIDFPVIITDDQNQPIQGFYRNLELDEKLTDGEIDQKLKELVVEFDKQNEPIKVTIQDSVVLQIIHFGHSSLIQQLKFFPFVQIFSITLYVFLGYLAFSFIRKQEQSSVWVGMSKETAHQLGTPLSGLLAWMEILSSQEPNEETRATLSEMKKDIDRLLMVTERFSKIGAKPELTPQTVTDLVDETLDYMRKRFPGQPNRPITITSQSDGNIPDVKLNSILFKWVIENIIKNALDATSEKHESLIQVLISRQSRWVQIDIKDNGKGLSARMKNDVFRPGFTTKKRGWGMGLSLSKRIIEEYHKGKIKVHETQEGVGMTFRIEIPV